MKVDVVVKEIQLKHFKHDRNGAKANKVITNMRYDKKKITENAKANVNVREKRRQLQSRKDQRYFMQ